MASQQIRTLPIAVRVFPEHLEATRDSRSGKLWRDPEGILIIQTETCGRRRGLLASYRVLIGGECVEEGLFYHDLSRASIRLLKNYAKSHHLATGQGRFKSLQLLTRHEFLKVFYDLAYKARCLVVGFSLPVHLSRVAFNSATARGFFDGAFSLGLWSYIDKKGRVNRKRALIGFTARNAPDEEDLIPEGSESGEPRPGYRFPGHFLDARTLAFALADELYSLKSACEAFGVKHA